MKITTKQSVVYAKPILERGKAVMQKVKFGNREVECPVVEHVRLNANVVADVDDRTATEWIDAGLAVKFDPVIDGEAAEGEQLRLIDDETKKPDPLG